MLITAKNRPNGLLRGTLLKREYDSEGGGGRMCRFLANVVKGVHIRMGL